MREVQFMGYDECPRCGEYKVATYVEVTHHKQPDQRPDGWRQYLPWNWGTPVLYKTFQIEQCKHCRKTVDMKQIDQTDGD